MPLYPVAVAASVLPLIAVHVCYVWAASLGHLEWCFPYTGNCASVSATGRQFPESFLFKGAMGPAAVLLAAYWFLCARWLEVLGCDAPKRRRILVVLGLVASIGLLVYTLALGSIGDAYRLQRRIGVTTFLGLTLVAQLLVTYLLGRTERIRENLRPALRRLELAAALLVSVGLSSVVLSAVDASLHRRVEDTIEWTFLLVLCCHGLLCASLWRATGFGTRFETSLPPAGRPR